MTRLSQKVLDVFRWYLFRALRMREAYVKGTPTREAVVVGFQHGALVVTAAAIIMMCVFAGFAQVSTSSTNRGVIKTIGFALTVGVLADAFLVRMLLVPARQ